MTHRPEGTLTDERLARLVQVEDRLEAKVRQAERVAEAQVESAREAARSLERERLVQVDAAARAEEDADLERHAEQLAQIAMEGAARVARWSNMSEAMVDGLARRAVAILLAREGARSP